MEPTEVAVLILILQACLVIYETLGFIRLGSPYYRRAPFSVQIDPLDLSDLDPGLLPDRKGRTPRTQYRFVIDAEGLAFSDRPSPNLRRQLSCFGYLQFSNTEQGTQVTARWAPVYWMSWSCSLVCTPAVIALGLWTADPDTALRLALFFGLILAGAFSVGLFHMRRRFTELYGELGQHLLDELARGALPKKPT